MKNLSNAAAFVATLLYVQGILSHASEIAPVPSILPARSDEDWRAFCSTPALRQDTLDSIKCIELTKAGPRLTLGGELRERFEWVNNPTFGFGDVGRDNVLLSRFMLHADVQSDNARFFVQLADHQASKRNFGVQSTDVDRLDVQQAFIDGSMAFDANSRATLRFGRQEISLGSSRLISVRDGPNVRRSFDGARAFIVAKDFRVDAFAVRPVRLSDRSFDDGSDRTTSFSGVYGSGLPVFGPVNKLDVYYLAYNRDRATFAQGSAAEHRYSVGARLFGKHGGFDWDFEAAYQFGKFGAADIHAWTMASDSGFTFLGSMWHPRLGIKADVASGDKNRNDRSLNTFNALFPKLPYFTEANVVAPANIIDIQPNLTFTPYPAVEVNVGWNVLWKQTTEDAYYGTPLNPVASTEGGGRYLGQQTTVGAAWRLTPRLTLSGTFVRFVASRSLREAGGRSGNFSTVQASYKF